MDGGRMLRCGASRQRSRSAATRISGLVVAIKGFTHMDQASAAEPVDLVQSLGNTVAVLRSKARSKSAAIAVEVEPNFRTCAGSRAS